MEYDGLNEAQPMESEDEAGSSPWIGFAPPTLVTICLEYISRNLSIAVKDDTVLPAEICDRLVTTYQQHARVTDEFANIFRDGQRTRLRRVKIRNSPITNAGLKVFLKHQLEELDIANCLNIGTPSMENIHRNMGNMKSLRIGALSPGLKVNIIHGSRHDVKPLKLKQLVLKEHGISDLRGYMHLLTSLTHLELTGCTLLIDPQCRLNCLVSLSLYNVWWIDKYIDWLCRLVNLKHLDISQHLERFGTFDNPNEKLAKLIAFLPKLESLDISGTNLAGTGTSRTLRNTAALCDIPGLSQRVNNPLQFLGLYSTAHAACYRHDIPALKISGQANEDQILTAATLYIHRPEILSRVLNDLYHLFRYESENHHKALDIVLKAMDAHVLQKHIQICGSATLFYIVKGQKSDSMKVKLRRHIITTLLNGMETHVDDATMMRNGCLILCQFKIPSDVVFDYERVVGILLSGVSNIHQESFVQRIAIYALNSLACQVDASQKHFLGERGVISIMLALIADRLKKKICDDVLELAWSTMWNVTDETPINSERFLKDNGLELFLGCLKTFPTKEELMRNMMGLLGNVAEVDELRPVFMADFLIVEFVRLLESNSDGIEVSYNAAGVLAHICSDGDRAWKIVSPTRKEVLRKMGLAIDKWNLKANRNINYRSFEPLIILLKTYHTPECQHWAIWALANLTSVYPEKYCALVKSENAVGLVQEILDCSTAYWRIRYLAHLVLANCGFDP